MLDFRVLGPLEAHRNGQPIALAGGKQRALLSLLLLRAGEVVSTDRLIDALWGELLPDHPATALQMLVSHLRQKLEPSRTPGEAAALLQTRAPGYVLSIERCTLDLLQFEELV